MFIYFRTVVVNDSCEQQTGHVCLHSSWQFRGIIYPAVWQCCGLDASLSAAGCRLEMSVVLCYNVPRLRIFL